MRRVIAAVLLLSTSPALAVSGNTTARPQTLAQLACRGLPEPLYSTCLWIQGDDGRGSSGSNGG